MIEADNGKVKIKGSGDQLLAELSTIVGSLSVSLPKDAIMLSVALGLNRKPDSIRKAKKHDAEYEKFLDELVKRVRDAQANKSDSDTKES